MIFLIFSFNPKMRSAFIPSFSLWLALRLLQFMKAARSPSYSYLPRLYMEPFSSSIYNLLVLDFTVWAHLIQFVGNILTMTSPITMAVNELSFISIFLKMIPFIDKGIREWIKRVEDTYAQCLLPFINPHQEQILRVLAGT